MELKYNNIYLKGKEEERKRRTIEVIWFIRSILMKGQVYDA